MQAEICVDKKKIAILGTGGTIAGTSALPADNVGYLAAQLGVGSLLDALALPQPAGFELFTEQVAQVDSKDMGFNVWRTLLLAVNRQLGRSDVQGVVITHGTDTLEETAWFLQLALDHTLLAAKPVVLTCAMRPATSRLADGPQNLLDAVAVASHPQARGVVAVCAGTIHGALEVQKVHTYRLDAFDSGDVGPVGYVEEGHLRMPGRWPEVPASRAWPSPVEIAATPVWPRVEIIVNYAGVDAASVDALIEHGLRIGRPVRGLVVAGTGNGTVHVALEAALSEAQAKGVQVVRSTRCTYGHVLPVAEQALPDSKGLSPVKARIAMMLALL